MTMIDIPEQMWPPAPPLFSGTSAPALSAQDTINMATADLGYGFVFQAREAMTIDRFGFNVQTAAATASWIGQCSVVSSSGIPTLVDAYGSAPGTLSISTTGIKEFTLGTAATLAAGDWACLLAKTPSGAPSANFAMSKWSTAINNTSDRPYYVKNIGAGWVKEGSNGQSLTFFARKSNGTYIKFPGWTPVSSVNQPNYSNTQTAKIYAARFTPLYKFRTAGLFLHRTGTTWRPGVAYLTDVASDNIFATSTVDDNYLAPINGRARLYWDSGATFIPTVGTNYCLSFVPSGGANLALPDVQLSSNAMLDAWPGGKDFYLRTSSTTAAPSAGVLSGATWSNWNTQIPISLGLCIDQIDYTVPTPPTVGGGIIRNPGYSGGYQ